MAKLGAILATQFKKLNIEINDALKPLIELDTDVPDDIASKFNNGLLTIEAAKSNSDVIKTIKANALDGVDKKMNEIITDLTLQPGDDFVNSQNTYEKVAMLSKLIHETGKKAAGAGSKTTAEEFAKKEADLQKALKDANDRITAQASEFQSKYENQQLDFDLKTILSGKDYIFPKEMDNGLKLNTAKGAIELELQKSGFSLKRNEAGQLIIVNKDGQPAYNDKHEALEPATFIDGALARNNMLKINDPNPQNPTPGPGTIPMPANPKGNAAVVAEIESEGFFK